MRYWLIELRREKGLTQKQVADLLGLSRAYYTQIETGQRNMTLAIAKLLCIKMDIPWDVFLIQE